MRIFGIAGLFIFLLLTGCSIQIDNSSSKSEKFAAKSEELASTFAEAKKSLEPLKDKQNLTVEDQSQVIELIDTLTNEIDEFKEEEAPFMAKKAKKTAVNLLDKKEATLLTIKEKAENGTATKEEVKEIIKTVSDDFEINLFK